MLLTQLEIRSICASIKKVFKVLEEDPWYGVSYNPIHNFPNKKNYPIEFQIFMEEIGEVSLESGGCQVLNIMTPYPLNGVDFGEYGIDYIGDFYMCECFLDNSENKSMYDNFSVFAWDSWDYSAYCFNLKEKPFNIHVALDIDDPISFSSSFILWFMDVINKPYAVKIKHPKQYFEDLEQYLISNPKKFV